MKMDLNANQASTALLRSTMGVDTLETNSLCCAAAGIIAPLSATAEALIPHEKLRGAALADAALNAQERPLAQPVVGYKHLSLEQKIAPHPAVPEAQIDERAEFEKEFPVPDGLQYCQQRGTYIWSPGASYSDKFAREHYAYRAGLAGWMRRSWKRATLDREFVTPQGGRP